MNSYDNQASISVYKWYLIAILVLVLAAGFLDGMEGAAAVIQSQAN
jgi:hypothetical protein